MDGVIEEADMLTPRATLESIAQQCDHALTVRIAKRYSTRDALKAVGKRARALLEQDENDQAFGTEYAKVVTTADAVFGMLIAEVEPAGHA